MKKVKFVSVFVILVMLLGTINVPVYAENAENYEELYLSFAKDADTNSDNKLNKGTGAMLLVDLNRDEVPELLALSVTDTHYDENGNALTASEDGYDEPVYKENTYTVKYAFSVENGEVVEDSPWNTESHADAVSMPCLPGESDGNDEFCEFVMYRNGEDYLAMRDIIDGTPYFSVLWYDDEGFGYSHEGFDEYFFNLYSTVDLTSSAMMLYDEENQSLRTYSDAMGLLLSEYEELTEFTFAEDVKTSELVMNKPVSFKASNWAVEGVNKAIEFDLMPPEMIGDDLTENITRAEFAAIGLKLYQAIEAKKPVSDSVAVSDSKPIIDIADNKYGMYIKGAYDLGITRGTGENSTGVAFSPELNITREDLATMLYRIIKMNNIDKMISGEAFGTKNPGGHAHTLKDLNTVSGYAYDGVVFLCNYRIINGVSNTTFAPFDYATREQAIVLSLRIYEFFLSSLSELQRINR